MRTYRFKMAGWTFSKTHQYRPLSCEKFKHFRDLLWSLWPSSVMNLQSHGFCCNKDKQCLLPPILLSHVIWTEILNYYIVNFKIVKRHMYYYVAMIVFFWGMWNIKNVYIIRRLLSSLQWNDATLWSLKSLLNIEPWSLNLNVFWHNSYLFFMNIIGYFWGK